MSRLFLPGCCGSVLGIAVRGEMVGAACDQADLCASEQQLAQNKHPHPCVLWPPKSLWAARQGEHKGSPRQRKKALRCIGAGVDSTSHQLRPGGKEKQSGCVECAAQVTLTLTLTSTWNQGAQSSYEKTRQPLRQKNQPKMEIKPGHFWTLG